MSGGFAMVALRTRRTTFVVLVVVSAIAYFAVGSFASRALVQSEADAQDTAKALATAGVASVLEPEDVVGPIEGVRGEVLLDRLQRGVLTDGTVFRVRVWSPEGGLLFSTDAADDDESLGDLPSIGTATKAQGRPTSRLVDGDIFETYVPLRLGETDALGAVQVDQGYAPIAERAASPWALLRTLSIASGGFCLLLAIIATLPIGVARNGGFGAAKPSRKRGSKKAKLVASGASPKELAKVQARADRAEAARDEVETQLDQLRSQIVSADENAGRQIGELETQLRDALDREEQSRVREAAATHASSADPANEVELDTLRTELAVTQERADQGARLAQTADQTLLGFESRVQELEGVVVAARLEAAEATAKLEAMQAEADAESETGESSEMTEHLAEVEALAAEAQSRAAEAEERAAMAEERVLQLENDAAHAESLDSNASTLIAQLEGQLMEERGRLAELQAGSETVAAGAERAQESVDEAERRAADRDIEMAAAQIRASEAERSSRAAQDRAAEAERVAAEAQLVATEADARVVQAEAAAGEATTSIAEAEARDAELQAQVEELTGRVTDDDRTRQEIEARAVRAEELAETAGADLAASTTRLGEADERMDELEKELSLAVSRAERADELTGTLEEAGIRTAELESFAREATARVAELESELANEQEAHSATRQATESSSHDLDAVSLELETVRQELAASHERFDEAQAARADADAVVEQIRAEAHAALAQARADAEAAQEAALAQSQTYLDSALEQARAEAQVQQAEMARQHQVAIEQAEQEAQALVVQAKEEAEAETHTSAELARAEARARLAALEAELSEADARGQSFEAQLAEHRAEIESSHAAAAAAEARAEEAATVADQARGELTEVTASAQAAHEANAELQARIDDVELRAAEATASAQAFKVEAEETRAIVASTQAEAAAAVETAQTEATAAIDKSRRDAFDAVRRKTGDTDDELVSEGEGAASPDGSTSEENAELRSTVAELEDQLEMMSERLRHAYAQAESVQATLSTARNTGAMPTGADPEVRSLTQEVERLRAQLDSSMVQKAEAEERAARAEADLVTNGKGVPPDAPSSNAPASNAPASNAAASNAAEDGAQDEPAEEVKVKRELSLRSRLANTAARKKQRGSPEDDASGF